VFCQAPERERFELTLGEHDGGVYLAKDRWLDAGHDVQHVGPAGRAEALLPGFEIAGGIAFEFRVIPAQSVFANLIGCRIEVRNYNPGVIAALAADDLRTG
jgi:hypothetical protein